MGNEAFEHGAVFRFGTDEVARQFYRGLRTQFGTLGRYVIECSNVEVRTFSRYHWSRVAVFAQGFMARDDHDGEKTRIDPLPPSTALRGPKVID